MLCVGYLETVDCRIFVIRSPWLWRYTGKVSIWSRYLSNQHFGPWMVTNIIFVAHIERVVIVDANPVQWDAAEKDRIGESSSLPNNSIPPAGPSWLPSYLWQPTKLVRVISGYPEWRLFPGRREEHVWRDLLGDRGWDSPWFLDFPAERLFPWFSSNCLQELMPKHIGRIWIIFCVARG